MEISSAQVDGTVSPTFAGPPDELWVISSIIDVSSRRLITLIKNMENLVTSRVIVTNKGKKQRTVYAPDDNLAYVQRAILAHILGPEQEKTLDGDIHGFVKGRGIVSNASAHLGREVVVNIDLKDFFPGILANRVYRTYEAMGFGRKSAWWLTRLTTHQGFLAQGFPTSPALANLVAERLDKRLRALAQSRGLTYTRYADDLTFSGDGHSDIGWLIKAVKQITADCGFEVNPKKIAIMRHGRRQKVTGLVVNGDHTSPRVPRRKLAELRAACLNFGKQSAEKKMEIQGWISFVQGVNPSKADMLRKQIEKGEKFTWPT